MRTARFYASPSGNGAGAASPRSRATPPSGASSYSGCSHPRQGSNQRSREAFQQSLYQSFASGGGAPSRDEYYDDDEDDRHTTAASDYQFESSMASWDQCAVDNYGEDFRVSQQGHTHNRENHSHGRAASPARSVAAGSSLGVGRNKKPPQQGRRQDTGNGFVSIAYEDRIEVPAPSPPEPAPPQSSSAPSTWRQVHNLVSRGAVPNAPTRDDDSWNDGMSHVSSAYVVREMPPTSSSSLVDGETMHQPHQLDPEPPSHTHPSQPHPRLNRRSFSETSSNFDHSNETGVLASPPKPDVRQNNDAANKVSKLAQLFSSRAVVNPASPPASPSPRHHGGATLSINKENAADIANRPPSPYSSSAPNRSQDAPSDRAHREATTRPSLFNKTGRIRTPSPPMQDAIPHENDYDDASMVSDTSSYTGWPGTENKLGKTVRRGPARPPSRGEPSQSRNHSNSRPTTPKNEKARNVQPRKSGLDDEIAKEVKSWMDGTSDEEENESVATVSTADSAGIAGEQVEEAELPPEEAKYDGGGPGQGTTGARGNNIGRTWKPRRSAVAPVSGSSPSLSPTHSKANSAPKVPTWRKNKLKPTGFLSKEHQDVQKPQDKDATPRRNTRLPANVPWSKKTVLERTDKGESKVDSPPQSQVEKKDAEKEKQDEEEEKSQSVIEDKKTAPPTNTSEPPATKASQVPSKEDEPPKRAPSWRGNVGRRYNPSGAAASPRSSHGGDTHLSAQPKRISQAQLRRWAPSSRASSSSLLSPSSVSTRSSGSPEAAGVADKLAPAGSQLSPKSKMSPSKPASPVSIPDQEDADEKEEAAPNIEEKPTTARRNSPVAQPPAPPSPKNTDNETAVLPPHPRKSGVSAAMAKLRARPPSPAVVVEKMGSPQKENHVVTPGKLVPASPVTPPSEDSRSKTEQSNRDSPVKRPINIKTQPKVPTVDTNTTPQEQMTDSSQESKHPSPSPTPSPSPPPPPPPTTLETPKGIDISASQARMISSGRMISPRLRSCFTSSNAHSGATDGNSVKGVAKADAEVATLGRKQLKKNVPKTETAATNKLPPQQVPQQKHLSNCQGHRQWRRPMGADEVVQKQASQFPKQPHKSLHIGKKEPQKPSVTSKRSVGDSDQDEDSLLWDDVESDAESRGAHNENLTPSPAPSGQTSTLTEEALAAQNSSSPNLRAPNALAVPGYRGFLDKTSDLPNLLDDEVDPSFAEGPSARINDKNPVNRRQELDGRNSTKRDTTMRRLRPPAVATSPVADTMQQSPSNPTSPFPPRPPLNVGADMGNDRGFSPSALRNQQQQHQQLRHTSRRFDNDRRESDLSPKQLPLHPQNIRLLQTYHNDADVSVLTDDVESDVFDGLSEVGTGPTLMAANGALENGVKHNANDVSWDQTIATNEVGAERRLEKPSIAVKASPMNKKPQKSRLSPSSSGGANRSISVSGDGVVVSPNWIGQKEKLSNEGNGKAEKKNTAALNGEGRTQRPLSVANSSPSSSPVHAPLDTYRKNQSGGSKLSKRSNHSPRSPVDTQDQNEDDVFPMAASKSGASQRVIKSDTPHLDYDEQDSGSESEWDEDEDDDSWVDLSRYSVDPSDGKKLVKMYRKLCRRHASTGGSRAGQEEDARKTFALFEMRSRIMETDIERGLARRGGTAPVDDIVLSPHHMTTLRIRDAIIVSKAWRDGASPRDVQTASLLTRKSTHTHFIRRRRRNVVEDESAVAQGFPPVLVSASEVYWEEVTWMDDADLMIMRCASPLGPGTCMRGFHIFTVGDCQSMLLKLSNERCMQLRNELEDASIRQLHAEDAVNEEVDQGFNDGSTVTEAEMVYMRASEEVGILSRKLALAEKSFFLVRDRIARLIAEYESMLVQMEEEGSDYTMSDDEDEEYLTDEYSTSPSAVDDDAQSDSGEDMVSEREKRELAERAAQAEERAEVASREAKLAKEEAERIREEKEKELKLLQKRLDDLEKQSVMEKQRSENLVHQYEKQLEMERQSAIERNSTVDSSGGSPLDKSDARSLLQGAESSRDQEKINSLKEKFRARHLQKNRRGGHQLGDRRHNVGVSSGMGGREGRGDSTKIHVSANRDEGTRHTRWNREEEMFQQMDFYERSLQAVESRN